MGKRKSRMSKLAAPNKRIEKLDIVFDCPFCGHHGSVNCEIDKKERIGQVACSVCGENFITKVHALTEAIDIYSEWIDECERVNINTIATDYQEFQYDEDDAVDQEDDDVDDQEDGQTENKRRRVCLC